MGAKRKVTVEIELCEYEEEALRYYNETELCEEHSDEWILGLLLEQKLQDIVDAMDTARDDDYPSYAGRW